MKQTDTYLHLLRSEQTHANGQIFVCGLLADTKTFSLIGIFGNEPPANLLARWQQVDALTDNFVRLVENNPQKETIAQIRRIIAEYNDLRQSKMAVPEKIGDIPTFRRTTWDKIFGLAESVIGRLEKINEQHSEEFDKLPVDLYTVAALRNLFDNLKKLTQNGIRIIDGRAVDWVAMCEGRAPKKHRLTWNLVHQKHADKKNLQVLYEILREIGFNHTRAVEMISVWFVIEVKESKRYKHLFAYKKSSFYKEKVEPLLNAMRPK
jgi:hypothetical protein